MMQLRPRSLTALTDIKMFRARFPHSMRPRTVKLFRILLEMFLRLHPPLGRATFQALMSPWVWMKREWNRKVLLLCGHLKNVLRIDTVMAQIGPFLKIAT